VPEIGPSKCRSTVRFARESDVVFWSLAACVYTKGLQTFSSKGILPLLQAGSQAARGNITVTGTPNRLNYCVTAST
jgi:hypothetical protein